MQHEVTGSERDRSLFQQELSKRELHAHKAFLEDDKVLPPVFEPLVEMEVKNEKIARSFAHVEDLHVLQTKSRTSDPPRDKRVAVMFSGGPAAGGHNVLFGIQDALGKHNTLLGAKGGPGGFLQGDLFEIEDLSKVKNQGGFDFLGTDRTKIKNKGLLEQARRVCWKHKLDAVIIVGGDDSNTNAAILAEYLYQDGISVIGVPKTMDGDLQAGEYLPIPFGFDTATKVYGELVGNLLRDTTSSKKYWHVVRLMGRDASHVTLEVALQTKPQVALISEEIQHRRRTLQGIVDEMAHGIIKRASHGKPYGLILIPEGLLEFIPELKGMMDDVSTVMKKDAKILLDRNLEYRRKHIQKHLKGKSRKVYSGLPYRVQEMMTLSRDDHGNLRVSQIPTEELIVEMLIERINKLAPGLPLKTVTHFFGYEGRCGPPSVFDAWLGYNLGLTAGSLVLDGRTGYMSAFGDFDKGGRPYAVPLVGLVDIEERSGNKEFVIKKTKVTMADKAFRYFCSRRTSWLEHDCGANPGPRQYEGKTANQLPITVALNKGYKGPFFKL
ncbi:diphosphate--fructose-6-phosphate 1-phosphotransferase [Candidatus Woesearchaeota archaeon]|nr:diphosphate--fructose-6-phosphate 1-phosphotransferase [Candidatus Woesearchaeota archaeon]